MIFEYVIEKPVSTSGKETEAHFIFNPEADLLIQTQPGGFCVRTEPLLKTYLKTVLSGTPLPGFHHAGSLSVGDDQIRPILDVLSYKTFVEQKLERVNRAISAQAGRILAPLGELYQGRLSS